MTVKTQKILASLLLIASGLYLLAMFQAGFLHQGVTDFGTYYHTTSFALQERGKNPYSNHAPFPPYYYPPPSVLLFSPLLLMDQAVGKTLFSGLSILAALLSVYLIMKMVAPRISYMQKALLFGAVSFFYPLWFTVSDGQVNAYLLLLITLGFYYYSKKQDFRAGVSLCLATIFKITPGLLIFYFLLKKRWKILLAATILFLTLSLVAELKLGHGINWMYWRYIANDVSAQGGANYRDQSLNAFVTETRLMENIWESYLEKMALPPKITERTLNALLSYALIGFLTLLVLFKSWRDKVLSQRTLILEYSLLLMIAILGSGLTWFHHYTILLFPFTVALLYLFRLPPSRRKMILTVSMALSYVLMAVSLENQFYFSNQLVSIQKSVMFFGALILAGVLVHFRYFNGLREIEE